MRRNWIALCAILLALTLPLYASGPAFEVALGPSVDAASAELMTVSFAADVDSWRFFLQTDMGESFDLAADYDLPLGETFHNNFILAGQILPSGSGFATLSYTLSQQLEFAPLLVEWGFGAQVGLFWSVYSERLLGSLSPLLDIGLGFAAGSFDLMARFTMNLEEEVSWRATPALALETGVDIENHVRLFARGYVEFEEFLMNPFITIASYGFKCGMAIRGNG